MRKMLLLFSLVAAALLAKGCGSVGGPTFWWDDRNQERLSDGYQLPPDPGAPVDYAGYESDPAMASGEDISEDNLRDFHTDLDLEEEKRKSESSLVDF